MANKELWCDLHAEFEAEHEREPTDEEMRNLYSNYCADIGDYYRKAVKEGMVI